MLDLTREIWDERVYSNTEIKRGNPLNTKDTAVKVIMLSPQEEKMEEGISREYAYRYPELKETREKYVVLEQTNKIKTSKNEWPTSKKVIKAIYEDTEESIYEILTKIKEETKNTELVVTNQPRNMTTDRYRKYMEAIFHKSKTQVTIYATQKTNENREKKYICDYCG